VPSYGVPVTHENAFHTPSFTELIMRLRRLRAVGALGPTDKNGDSAEFSFSDTPSAFSALFTPGQIFISIIDSALLYWGLQR
jgi:hypothetical protein